MLHRNMIKAESFQRGLQALLAELQLARDQNNLGKLALLCYCELRRWAREAGESELAERCAGLITGTPHASRQAFLADIDGLIAELAALEARLALPAPASALPELISEEAAAHTASARAA